jgi:hypothetical protein
LVAAEILCCDIEAVINTVVQEKELLDILFSPLNTPFITPSLWNLWIRATTCVLQRKPIEVSKFVLCQDKTFVQNLVNQIGIAGMEELLLKLMGCEAMDANSEPQSPFTSSNSGFFSNQLKFKIFESQNSKLKRTDSSYDIDEIGKWWLSHDISTLLISKLDPQFDSEVHANVTKVLSQIVKRSLSMSSSSSEQQVHPLAVSIMSTQVLENLVDKLLDNPHSSIMLNGLTLLSVLLEVSVDMLEKMMKHQQQTQQNEEKLSPVIMVVLSRLPKFVSLLQNPPASNAIHTSFGTLDPPLGEMRLRVIEFVSTLFHIRSEHVETEVVKSGVLAVITDLFFQYEFNNLLHNLFLKIISYILAGECVNLKKSLFADCKIVDRIVRANKANEEAMFVSFMFLYLYYFRAHPKGIRKGYMGHITIISNGIVTTAKSQSQIAQMLKESQGWKEFVDTSLAISNHLNSAQIGGPNPLGNVHELLEKQFEGFNDEMEEDDKDFVLRESNNDHSDSSDSDDENMEDLKIHDEPVKQKESEEIPMQLDEASNQRKESEEKTETIHTTETVLTHSETQ